MANGQLYRKEILKLLRFFVYNCQLSLVPCVVLPPVPRYLTGGCCDDSTHASNAGKTGEDSAMVKKLMHLCKLLRTELAASKCTNYWVPEVLEHLSATAVGGTATVQVKSQQAKELFSSDNVHLNGLGYTRLTECICESLTLAAARSRDTADCIVSGGKKSYYWRGFNSIRGGSRSAFTASTSKSKHTTGGTTGGRGFHPYRARGGYRGRGCGSGGGSRGFRN